jgi:hypothetical protein
LNELQVPKMWEVLVSVTPQVHIEEFIRIYLPGLIFAIISSVSVLHFLKTKRIGQFAVSIGFVLLTVGWFVLPGLLLNASWACVYFAYSVFYVLPALIILVGFILLYNKEK